MIYSCIEWSFRSNVSKIGEKSSWVQLLAEPITTNKLSLRSMSDIYSLLKKCEQLIFTTVLQVDYVAYRIAKGGFPRSGDIEIHFIAANRSPQAQLIRGTHRMRNAVRPYSHCSAAVIAKPEFNQDLVAGKMRQDGFVRLLELSWL